MNPQGSDGRSNVFRVLIVDDMPDNLQILGRILVNRGIDVMFASNGREALDSVGFQKPIWCFSISRCPALTVTKCAGRLRPTT